MLLHLPGTITYFGPRNEDVSSLILSVRYALGYMSAGDIQNDMSVAALVNLQGETVNVTTKSLQVKPTTYNMRMNATLNATESLHVTAKHMYDNATYILHGTVTTYV